ncbi:hypothetical protein AKJ09_03731 [Labilithrix luteola]|uniref:Uncharacterized protein n=1 Tax=Labilithrix luteola TaxID=1391654 RepID=A0A0K1PU71_9BACT|nr:type I restriction enzyme HsdR N-terminal domain-containing protein [Labilithrix luteola]AKU97067.1 hypothetical protein AKJ09_03731 [Labilithrix luteola]
MNEETFKNAIVVPFLRSVGFDESELVFESTFTIQLGRSRHTVTGKAHGRLDILCKRDGNNLLIAELKAPSERVDTNAARQAISYARLLEPMAPFVLISNGHKSHLFNTLTSEQIEQVDRQGSYRPDIDTDLRLRYEALLSFVGYSLDNLIAFSTIQRQRAMRPFEAASGDAIRSQLTKKFIPALSVERTEALERVHHFVREARQPILACIGPSGCGKTVLACQLPAALPAPTLFYSGTLLGESLLSEIAFDFNLTFSAQESDISILRKVTALTRAHQKHFIIIIDAIDEWRANNKSTQLDRLSAVAAQLGLKVILTCKDEHWPQFLTERGISRPLAEHLDVPILQLGTFTQAERSDAISRATAFLNLKPENGRVTDNEALRHPFTLRVVTEIAANDGVPLGSVHSSSRLVLQRFLELSLAKTSPPSLGQRVLVALAHRLLSQSSFHCTIDVLRQDLGLTLLDDLPNEIFLSGLLLRHADNSGIEYVTFYHSHIRDYVIAIMIGRLSTSESSARKRWISIHSGSSPGIDAVLYFAATGTQDEQRDTLEAFAEGEATRDGEAIARLLSWGVGIFSRDILEGVADRLLSRLFAAFERAAHDDGGVRAHRIVDAICRLVSIDGAERTLVAMVELIARSANSVGLGMHQVADALVAFDSPECTARLVTILRDPKVDGYVRRYVATAVERRTFEGRTELFLGLVMDADPNVLSWIRSWYPALETSSLRDRLLEIHDTAKTSYVAKEVCKLLALSRLQDTGHALFVRLDLSKNQGWLCRAIAELDYRPATQRLISLLRNDPFSNLGGDVMIAMSEMPSVEFVSPLIDLVTTGAKRLLDARSNYWLAQALANSATKEHLHDLAKYLHTAEDDDLSYCLGLTMLFANDEHLLDTVLEALVDDKFGKHGDALLAWLPVVGQRSLSERQLQLLERRLRMRKSVMALIVVGTRMNDGIWLAKLVREVLPSATDDVKGEIGWNQDVRPKLRAELDDWAASRLLDASSSDASVRRLLELIPWIGGRRSLEALRIADVHLARATSHEWVARTEHALYRALADDERQSLVHSDSRNRIA